MSLPTKRSTIPISTIDVAILIVNLHFASRDPQIGFEDADRTLGDLIRDLKRYVPVRISVLESALWASNLNSEKKKFFHPTDQAFADFVKKLLEPDHKFDPVFNTIEETGLTYG